MTSCSWDISSSTSLCLIMSSKPLSLMVALILQPFSGFVSTTALSLDFLIMLAPFSGSLRRYGLRYNIRRAHLASGLLGSSRVLAGPQPCSGDTKRREPRFLPAPLYYCTHATAYKSEDVTRKRQIGDVPTYTYTGGQWHARPLVQNDMNQAEVGNVDQQRESVGLILRCPKCRPPGAE